MYPYTVCNVCRKPSTVANSSDYGLYPLFISDTNDDAPIIQLNGHVHTRNLTVSLHVIKNDFPKSHLIANGVQLDRINTYDDFSPRKADSDNQGIGGKF